MSDTSTHTTTTDLKAKFWDRLAKVQAGMLGLKSDNRLVPMSPNLDDDPNEVWFITAQGTDLVNACTTGPQEGVMVVSDAKAGLYADIAGTLSLSTDRAKLDELWNAVASAWYEDGKDDPDVRLLKFVPSSAEVWLTDTSALKFLFEIAKGNLTDRQPDMGDHGSLRF